MLRDSATIDEAASPQSHGPLPPEETLTKLEVPNGFEIHVFAHEPNIINPIALAWDERGRLWVVESTNYVSGLNGQPSNTDRITICEDTDGDYRADTFTRFAENLPLTTGIALVHGGAIVGQTPDLIFLEDLDGDDQFDEKHVIVGNAFGTSDPHAVMSNLKIGLDNYLWGSVGYSGLYKPGHAPDPEARILRSGVFRVRTDGTDLEPIAEFNANTWGVGIGEDNVIYGSSTTHHSVIEVKIPLRFNAGRNTTNMHPHQPARDSSLHPLHQANFRKNLMSSFGASPYHGRRFPSEYWETLMVAKPIDHEVHAIKLTSNERVKKESDTEILKILTSRDEWVTPVFAEIGPDENLWVADLYHPDLRNTATHILSDQTEPSHTPTNSIHHHETGRVYIITYGEITPKRDLSHSDPSILLQALQSTSQHWRLTAQRMLIARGAKGLEEDLIHLATRKDLDPRDFDPGAVHALWTLHGLGSHEILQQLAPSTLSHPSPAVRNAAIQTLAPTLKNGKAMIESHVFADPDLNVRLTALLRALDFEPSLQPMFLRATKEALPGADPWILAAYNALNPIGTIRR